MTTWTLVARSLRFHWRAHLGVFLGALLGTAILVGALAVGDSIRFSLRALALERLGDVSLALHGGSRFFREELATAVGEELGNPTASLILLPGSAVAGGGRVRAGQVQVVGVTPEFWRLGGLRTYPLPGGSLLGPGDAGVAINERLADRLGARVGEELLLRVNKPSLLSRDAPLSKTDDAAVAIRLAITAITSSEHFARFSLQANQVPPYNAFISLPVLQRELEQAGRANVLLVAGNRTPLTAARAAEALRRRWTLADAGLELRRLPRQGVMELRTSRVFLDPPVAEAARGADPGSRGVLTYFVNELRKGSRATPYSTVAALEAPPVPEGMPDDEIVINRWLADDLGAGPGDTITLKYYVVGPQRRLSEQEGRFRVRAVVPIAGSAADRDLMPEFPGVAESDNCRDWEPGIPVDLKRIRDKDERYWDDHRGTPKAFITLKAGRKLWDNRFGNLTAVRYPLTGKTAGTLETRLRQALDPAAIGLFFAPVREQALAASGQAMDFGQLFIGFSFFLIVAALLLTALLFGLGVEQRSEEIGVLLALGFPPRQVRRMLLLEGALLAVGAGILGAAAGVAYTRAVVWGLSTVWSGAVASSTLSFHVEPATLASGAVIGFLTGLLSLWLVARKQAQQPARVLLTGGTEGSTASGEAASGWRRPGARAALVGLGGGLLTAAAGFFSPPERGAELFFGAGSLLLIGGLGACRLLLAQLERGEAARTLSLVSLGLRNTVRRRTRSLAAVSLLAAGSFLVVAVGASRHDPNTGAAERHSGTGGFALFAESSLPVHHDLNSAEGRDQFGLDAAELNGARVLPLRLKDGDEASCLNLNRALNPRILGVDPVGLRERGAFTFASLLDGSAARDPWSLLDRVQPDGAIPAVGDTNTVVWSLGKGVGDTVAMTDERGRPIELRIVGVLANSVLQGGLVVSEEQFMLHFPGQSGYRVFLIDAPADRTAAVRETLMEALADVGIEAVPAPQRLADFNTVENTYLSIFAALGGLGLLLGSLGLGVVVLRNVLERRGELALLRAVGFRISALRWLVFSEHALLLALGLAVGVAAAMVAVLPALRSPGAGVPYVSLALTLAAVLVGGAVWTWGASALALRGSLLGALRSE